MPRTKMRTMLDALNLMAGQNGDRQATVYATPADNAATTISIAAPGVGKRILLNNACFNFSDIAVEKAVTVTDGVSTVITSNRLLNQLAGYVGGDNLPLSFSMAASGTGGKIGYGVANYSIIDSTQATLTA